ncbi:MAG TPA: hypothetical protein DCG52_01430 [Alphaproteobacteria bacterium]|nr:hypothetical protein [Alphaproteobacteria bacterium]
MTQLYFWFAVSLILFLICFYFMKSTNIKKTFFFSFSSFIIISSILIYMYLGNPSLVTFSDKEGLPKISTSIADELKDNLSLDPQNQKILWFLGVYEFQNKNFDQALKYWNNLMSLLPEGTEQYFLVEALIKEIESGF